MWDDRAVFRGLWQRIARLFGGGGRNEQRHAPGSIPAPETLVAKIQNVKNKDRDILRVASEAVRRGHPDQAVIAYWKAVQVYLKDGQLLKAVSALKMILQHAPEDLEAFNALADAYEALDRKRDAANTCLWIADIHARRAQKDEALAVLYRSLDLDPMVKGARERILALGGELPASARPASQMGPQLRLQSKQEPAAQPRPASELAARPPSQMKASPGLPPIQGRAMSQAAPPAASSEETPAIVGIPLSSPPQPIAEEEEPMEMPGERAFDDDKLELDIEGDDAVDFPDDSLVLPVTEAKPSPVPVDDLQAGTMLASDDEIESEGMETIAMPAIDTDGAATIAMAALSDDGEVMSEDLAGDQTVLAMEAPPWDGTTDEHYTRALGSSEEITDHKAPAPSPARKFSIPAAATTVDLNPPSAMQGSEHDPSVGQPKVGIPGEATRAYTIEELRKLGVKPKD